MMISMFTFKKVFTRNNLRNGSGLALTATGPRKHFRAKL